MTKNNEYIRSVAEDMLSQLKATVGISVMWSWGLDKMTYTLCNGGMPSLQIHVNGRLFKGYVLIALDEGTDTYQIFVKKTLRGELKCICDEAYCDNFGQIIDRYVEQGDSEQEYKQWIERGGFLI